ncbi:MAG: DNA primase, partial [Burkholderiales bacterium]
NALVGYLAAVSRKLKTPLALIVQSTSAAGKSALMEAVLDLVPEEDRVHYSAMTGQSLFYLGESDLKHKLLAIAEEEGVRQAAYALKLLQSQGELTIASTGKDPATGRLVTEEYRVEGPVMLFLTTTAIDLDEELLNRCLVLTVNESREQTRRIQQRQRLARTLEGLLARSEAQSITILHRNAQRLLRPLSVVNPFAERLGFLDDRTRTRRDHQKYLTLIDSIALLHQHQRTVRSVTHRGEAIDYIEVTAADIALAHQLAPEVLGRSLDELPPQTRRVLGGITTLVSEQCQARSIERKDFRFSRRELRAATALSDTQLRVHLERLVAMEYLLVHRGARGQSFVYELTYDGEIGDNAPRLPGLIDVDAVPTTETSRGETPHFAGSSRPQNGVNAGGVRGTETPASAQPHTVSSSLAAEAAETAPLGTP